MFDPTKQQTDIVARAEDMARGAKAGDAFKVGAYAGTGKTSTGVLIARALNPMRLWYLAFNKPIAVEASRKYPKNTKATTGHSPAWKAMIASGRLRNELVFGVTPIVKRIEDDAATYEVRTKTKAQKPRKAAFVVVQTLNRFLQSADEEPTVRHVPKEWTSTINDEKGRKAQAEVVAKATADLWRKMMEDPSVPITHDCYLKAWALLRPKLPFDAIFFDEAQDANGVMLDLVRRQDAQQIFIGDEYQSIYKWRGAVDAMRKAPGDKLPLTRSFRFGENVAAEANVILGMLGADLPLEGAGPVPGRISDDPEMVDGYGAVLCRGNSGVLSETLGFLDRDKRVAVVGGTGEVVKTLRAAHELFDGGRPQHPELGLFDSWDELCEFAETDDGAQLKPTVRVVERYGDGVPGLCNRLQYDTVKEEEAEVVVSTAHKAKGREWPSVRLSDDFGPLAVEDDELPGRFEFRRDEAHLLYVAVTRGMESVNLGGMARQIRADARHLEAKLPGGRPLSYQPPPPVPVPARKPAPPVEVVGADIGVDRPDPLVRPGPPVTLELSGDHATLYSMVLEDARDFLAKGGPDGLMLARHLERLRGEMVRGLAAASRRRDAGEEDAS